MDRLETAVPDCTDPHVGQNLLAYEARHLDREGVEGFEEHLLLCSACRDELEAGISVAQALHAARERSGMSEATPVLQPKMWSRQLAAVAAVVLVAVGVFAWLNRSRELERSRLIEEAFALETSGDHRKAEVLFKRARAVRESRFVLHRLGVCALRLGRQGEAEVFLRNALVLPVDEGRGDVSSDGLVAQTLGEVLFALGRFQEVERICDEWLSGEDVYEAWGRAMLYAKLARRAYFENGDRTEGERLLALAGKANEDLRRLQPDPTIPHHESPYYRQALFAKLVDVDGDFAEAVVEAERILALKRVHAADSGDQDHVADGLNFVGSARMLAARVAEDPADRMELLDRAQEALKESRRLRETVTSPGSRIGVVWAVENLGLVALERGDAGKAVALMEEARDLLSRIKPPPARDRGELLVNLGTAYAAAGRSDDARRAYLEAREAGAGRRTEVAVSLGLHVLGHGTGTPEAVALAEELRVALGERLGARLLEQVRAGLTVNRPLMAGLPRLEVL